MAVTSADTVHAQRKKPLPITVLKPPDAIVADHANVCLVRRRRHHRRGGSSVDERERQRGANQEGCNGQVHQRFLSRRPLQWCLTARISYKPRHDFVYVSAECSRLYGVAVGPRISMRERPRVEGFIRPLRGIVARREDAYRVQSSSLRTSGKETGSVPFSVKITDNGFPANPRATIAVH